MPLYKYNCKTCGDFDEFNTVSKRKNCRCPTCGKIAQHEITPVRIDYYNMGVSESFPTAVDKWDKMHRAEARRKYD